MQDPGRLLLIRSGRLIQQLSITSGIELVVLVINWYTFPQVAQLKLNGIKDFFAFMLQDVCSCLQCLHLRFHCSHIPLNFLTNYATYDSKLLICLEILWLPGNHVSLVLQHLTLIKSLQWFRFTSSASIILTPTILSHNNSLNSLDETASWTISR